MYYPFAPVGAAQVPARERFVVRPKGDRRMSQMLKMDWRLMFILLAWMLMVLAPLVVIRATVAPHVGQLEWIGICIGAFLTLTLPRTFMLAVREREERILLRPRWAELKWDLSVVFLTATIVSSFPPTRGWRSIADLAIIIVAVSAVMGLLIVRGSSRIEEQPRLFDYEREQFEEGAK